MMKKNNMKENGGPSGVPILQQYKYFCDFEYFLYVLYLTFKFF